jgi:(p)ppGpp synthase/HD superfamily hydrolase
LRGARKKMILIEKNADIRKARGFAMDAHDGTARKYTGDPYFNHVERVAIEVSIHPRATADMVMAAYLHDVVEDTDYTLEDIDEEFGLSVAEMVSQLTNVSKQFVGLNRAQRKAMDIARLAEAPAPVKVIKMIDRIDNLMEMSGATAGFRRMYAAESRALLSAIRDADRTLAERLANAILALEESVG